MTDTSSLNADTLWFTRGSRRHSRIGDTLRVVTEGARIEITLEDDGTTTVAVTHEAGVKVTRRVVAAPKPAARPAAKAAAARKPQAAAPKPAVRAAVRTAARPQSPQDRLAGLRTRTRVSA